MLSVLVSSFARPTPETALLSPPPQPYTQHLFALPPKIHLSFETKICLSLRPAHWSKEHKDEVTCVAFVFRLTSFMTPVFVPPDKTQAFVALAAPIRPALIHHGQETLHGDILNFILS